MHILDDFTMQAEEAKTGELNFEHQQSWRVVSEQRTLCLQAQMKGSSQKRGLFNLASESKHWYYS